MNLIGIFQRNIHTSFEANLRSGLEKKWKVHDDNNGHRYVKCHGSIECVPNKNKCNLDDK